MSPVNFSVPTPAPLELLDLDFLRSAGLTTYVKRDDRYAFTPGSPLQGNKVRKLLPVLERLATNGPADRPLRLLSFGGAFSNHLAALAAAGRRFDVPVSVYVRGEPVRNPVLDYARAAGVDLYFLDRTTYRRKGEAAVLSELTERIARQHGLPVDRLLVLPEGGTTPESLTATGRLFPELTQQLEGAPDYLCVSFGTGGTAAGLIGAAAGTGTTVDVYPALRGDWITGELARLTGGRGRYRLFSDHHFGGYARFPKEWPISRPGLASRTELSAFPGLPLEPVYTAKLFAGFRREVIRGSYPSGSTVVLLHTGGIY